jgi:hypothetical protein
MWGERERRSKERRRGVFGADGGEGGHLVRTKKWKRSKSGFSKNVGSEQNEEDAEKEERLVVRSIR